MTSNEAKFWDEMHRTANVGMVADHGIEKFLNLFNSVGPFAEDLGSAKSVLDVGPGFARVLRSCRPEVTKSAIEISDVNSVKLKEWGITPYKPGQALPPASVDLAWSTSCFNHCKEIMIRVLVQQVAEALVPGGQAYFEHVYALGGEWPESRMPIDGPFGMRLPKFTEICDGWDLLTVQAADVPIFDSPGCGYGRYFLRLRKEG